MDDLEGEVVGEEVHESGLWEDIFSADLNREDALLLNIGQHCAFGVAHNVSRLVCCERVGKVSQPRFNVVSECISAFVSHLDIAIRDSHSIHRMMVVDHHRLLRRLGVEDAHGDLLAPLGSFLLQIGFYILKPYGISVCLGWTDPARNDAVLQHPRRFPFADVKHLVELLQGYFALLRHHTPFFGCKIECPLYISYCFRRYDQK